MRGERSTREASRVRGMARRSTRRRNLPTLVSPPRRCAASRGLYPLTPTLSPQAGRGSATATEFNSLNEEQRMNPQIKSTTLFTGVTVEYVENGALGGTPLLLLHGLSDSWHSFLPLLPHLPSSVRALAFSQRGHGKSSKPRNDYRLEAV